MEFIAAEKSGRTRTLKLAPKFFDYFDVVQENLQQRMQEAIERQQTLTEEPKAEVVVADTSGTTGVVEVVADTMVPEPSQTEIPEILKPKKTRKRTKIEEKIIADTDVEPEQKRPVVVVQSADAQPLELERSTEGRLRELNPDDFGS